VKYKLNISIQAVQLVALAIAHKYRALIFILLKDGNRRVNLEHLLVQEFEFDLWNLDMSASRVNMCDFASNLLLQLVSIIFQFIQDYGPAFSSNVLVPV